MRLYGRTLYALFAVVLLIIPFSRIVYANEPTPNQSEASIVAGQPQSISEYWHPRVQQWSDLIVQESNVRHIDPDLVASLLWQESRGDNTAVGPVGAVGLMQIMPKEAGFTWRPAREALMNPETNLFWGTRTLATIVKQGKGDIFNTLAAYNGGWEQTMYRGPVIFATTILRDYAQAVRLRYELSDSWTAYFAVREADTRGPIWIADSRRSDVYLFGMSNALPGGTTLIPDMEPTATVAEVFDESDDLLFQVGFWLYDNEAERWVSSSGEFLDIYAPLPGVREAEWRPSVSLASGLDVEAVRDSAVNEVDSQLVSTPELPDPPLSVTETVAITIIEMPIITPTPSPELSSAGTAWYGISASKSMLNRNSQDANVSTGITVTDIETDITGSGDTIDGQANSCECSLGDLQLIAYPLEVENTVDGWRARIYAEGISGACNYSYAWNTEEDIRVSNVSSAATFYVSSPDRGRRIVGTVLVISGDEIARVPLYIESPD